MIFDEDLTACAALVQKADPDRFAAAMAGPVDARRILFPVYAFNVEVSRAPWVTQEAMIAEMRLQWWRDALTEIGARGIVRRHEVVTPLALALDSQGAEVLDRLVAARRWDIYRDPFEDAAHFSRYLDETGAGLMWAGARALGAEPEHEAAVRALGRAAGLARFLQAVPALEAEKRIPLVDGRTDAVRTLASDALATFSRRDLRRSVGRKAWPALTEAFAARDLLEQVVRRPHIVAEGGMGMNPLKRSLRLWQWA
ncbi:squalene/phytoene synthase family protein [uncultured Roseobacter sp.]|uniref:squalene/phytoene synthase family protein n=1 Tax=uncultured Roseobacter sp. TaxID=114847 RepID=UPI00261667E0|nr:squalene/phytoene synthase family protein [uncultured Roseobacter sp.]